MPPLFFLIFSRWGVWTLFLFPLGPLFINNCLWGLCVGLAPDFKNPPPTQHHFQPPLCGVPAASELQHLCQQYGSVGQVPVAALQRLAERVVTEGAPL